LATRSAHREELPCRGVAAQGAAERVAYRADSVRTAGRDLEQRLRRTDEHLAGLLRTAETERPDPGRDARIGELEQELARLERDREAELARQLAELEEQLAAARTAAREQAAAAEAARVAREQARERLEAARGELREAERAVE